MQQLSIGDAPALPRVELRIVLPGEPVPQGRGKVGRWASKDGRSGIAVRDPTKSRNWKAYAVGLYREALASRGLPMPLAGPAVPVEVELAAYFTCPASHHRKTVPVPQRPHVGPRGDVDNLLKAALDAGIGVLWLDDGQVYRARVQKLVAAQGEAPRVELTVRVPEPRPVAR